MSAATNCDGDGGAPLSDATPQNIGTASAGVGASASRDDHVHALPSLVTGATKGGTGKYIKTVIYDAYGRITSAIVEGTVGGTTPSNVGTAAEGVSEAVARVDHVHDLPATGPGSGAIGGAAQLLRSLTLDAKGRVTAATATDISGLTGVLNSAAGVLSALSAGVGFAKGPWKTFSTVRNGSAAQTLSIPVVDGENNGIVRAFGRLRSDGTDRAISAKINGSATNMTQQLVRGYSTTADAIATHCARTGTGGGTFYLVMRTAKTSNALTRAGLIVCHSRGANGATDTVSLGAFFFNDTTTTITSIDLDCANATGLAANTEAVVEEGIFG